MADIKIKHTMEDGTILTGSVRGDGVWELAKQAGFTYRRSVGIFIMGSRDRHPDTFKIRRAREALEAAGHSVTVELERTLRDPEVRAAAEADRLADRQERLADRADRLGTEGSALYQRASRMGDAIPLGQPSMPDHHSYKSDQSYRKRMRRTYDRAFETMDAAKEAGRQAEASADNQAHRNSGPVIQRRLANLAADERRWLRTLDGRRDAITDPDAPHGFRIVLVKPTGRRLDEILQRLAEVQADILYQRRLLADLVDDGLKVWGPDDFTKGDRVLANGWGTVKRVNKKSLTVLYDTWAYCDNSYPVPYSNVTDRRPADHEEEVFG